MTARDRLVRAGLPDVVADSILAQHAHELADRLRNIPGSGEGDAWNWWDAAEIPAACADLIDPPQPATQATEPEEQP